MGGCCEGVFYRVIKVSKAIFQEQETNQRKSDSEQRLRETVSRLQLRAYASRSYIWKSVPSNQSSKTSETLSVTFRLTSCCVDKQFDNHSHRSGSQSGWDGHDSLQSSRPPYCCSKSVPSTLSLCEPCCRRDDLFRYLLTGWRLDFIMSAGQSTPPSWMPSHVV